MTKKEVNVESFLFVASIVRGANVGEIRYEINGFLFHKACSITEVILIKLNSEVLVFIVGKAGNNGANPWYVEIFTNHHTSLRTPHFNAFENSIAKWLNENKPKNLIIRARPWGNEDDIIFLVFYQ